MVAVAPVSPPTHCPERYWPLASTADRGVYSSLLPLEVPPRKFGGIGSPRYRLKIGVLVMLVLAHAASVTVHVTPGIPGPSCTTPLPLASSVTVPFWFRFRVRAIAGPWSGCPELRPHDRRAHGERVRLGE